MELDEVQKAVDDFEKKLKPVTEQDKAMAAGKVLAAVEAPALPSGESCVTKDFKKVVGALHADYIGHDGSDIKDLVVEFLESLPECKE